MAFHASLAERPAAVADHRSTCRTIRRFSASGCCSSSSTSCSHGGHGRVLLHMYWPLGLVVAVAAHPGGLAVAVGSSGATSWCRAGCRTSRATSPARSRRRRSAIRVIKSFGRSRLQQRQVQRLTPRRSTTRRCDKVRLAARFWTFLEVIPNIAWSLVLLLGRGRGRAGRADLRHPGRVHHPAALAGVAGRGARRDPGDGAGGDDRRRPGARDLRHQARDRRRRPCAGGAARPPALRGRRLRVPRRRRADVLHDVDLDVAPARRSPSSARPAPARRR